MPQKPKPQRIAKFIAHAGVCSRRAAEKLIEEGVVSVNGLTIQSAALNITEKDVVAIKGKQIKARTQTRLWMYHKPPGLLCSRKDPEGRPTIFEDLEKKGLPYVVSVGRLDLNSEGLLLLTNDGDLSRKLELPKTGLPRQYRVRVKGLLKEEDLLPLQKGVTIEGIHYKPIEGMIERHQSSNTWVHLTLKEGKNREIRRIMEHLGFPVGRLIRYAYGPYELGKMKRGEVRDVLLKGF